MRAHVARMYCENCKRTFETRAALESHRSVPNAESTGICNYRDAPESAGITSEMVTRLKKRWRGATIQEKWDRICEILFPEEADPMPRKFTCTEV
jgi:hypothetical protein